MLSFSLVTRVSVQHQLLSFVAVFHVESVDIVAFDVTNGNLLRSAVLTPIGHCIRRRIE